MVLKVSPTLRHTSHIEPRTELDIGSLRSELRTHRLSPTSRHVWIPRGSDAQARRPLCGCTDVRSASVRTFPVLAVTKTLLGAAYTVSHDDRVRYSWAATDLRAVLQAQPRYSEAGNTSHVTDIAVQPLLVWGCPTKPPDTA
eukprot:COSAG01_NODE_4328_length_5129_cov_15.312724_7_plen_142_part_00